MDDIGPKIARLRKQKSMSQEQLATAAGISQATVSRLEKQEQEASIKTLAKLARALSVGLSELAPPEALRPGDLSDDAFYAFCENPFCARNKLKLADKRPTVYWESWQSYRGENWSDVNFCRVCGGDLVKECSSCGFRLTDKGGRFCTRCGKELTERPTEEEWTRIRAQLQPGEDFDDDIPF